MHENAAGIFINDPNTFNLDMNEQLKNVSTEIVHYVDYIWDVDNIDGQAIIDLAEMNDYLGTGFPRPLVYVKNCTISNYMIMKDKHLKINLPNCSVLMWDAPEELREKLENGESVTINFVAKCNINSYNFQRIPQLVIEDWEEKIDISTDIISIWGF